MGDVLTPDIVVAADGRPDSGLGHLSRGGALVASLRARGRVVAACALGADEPIEHDVRWLPVSSLEECLRPRTGGALVLDSYTYEAAQGRQFAPDSTIIVFGDGGGRAAGADLSVSVAAGGEGAGHALLGPAYACLRPSYWGVEPRGATSEVREVLVTAGATNTPVAIAVAIAEVMPSARVRMVVGRHAEVETAPGVELLVAPESLFDVLLESDLVVTAGGQTLLEALACGVPTIGLVLAENQRAQALVAVRRGAALLVDPPHPDAVASAAVALAADKSARAILVRAAQRMVDGLGAHRVAYAVDGLIRVRVV